MPHSIQEKVDIASTTICLSARCNTYFPLRNRQKIRWTGTIHSSVRVWNVLAQSSTQNIPPCALPPLSTLRVDVS
ncbi:3404_t:CDS:2 [Ambispora leptoticha]|uniref:3404_t:CDS:1 n=1 Tax=Ambispora leptoticha TaxID=144679 RepID=A0A9N8YV25_9GLOM|nr:3404_t:CDS:2 [Ambispora leptoticha]